MSNTPIIRNVQVAPEIKLDAPEISAKASRINSQTWQVRFAAMQQPEGYNTGKRILKITPFEQWATELKHPEDYPMWFIDGTFLFLAINSLGLFIDYSKLSESKLSRAPISYFATYYRDNDNVYRLFSRMQASGYNLVTKEVARIEPINYEEIKNHRHPTETAKWLEQRISTAEQRIINSSVIPDIIVQILSSIYDTADPDLNHVLIIANNPQLLPLVNKLRTMDIKVTLGVLSNRSVSNHFLQHFDHIINLVDLFTNAEALTQNFRTSTN